MVLFNDNMMHDKRGAVGTTSKVILWGVIVVGIIFGLLAIWFNWGGFDISEPVWLDTTQANINWDSPMGWALTYIFGITETNENAQTISAFIVLIAVWLIFFLSFGDTIDKFGFFDKGVAWVIGFAMAVILANLNMYYSVLVNLMSVFSFLAAGSVIAALTSIFVAMFAAHWGITSMAPWIMNRKAMMLAAESKAGGLELEGTIAGLKRIGKGLREK